MSTPTHPAEHRRSAYLNAVLTVIAVCLAVLALDRVDPAANAAQEPPRAGDQPGRGSGLVSAASQRKAMIAELQKLTKRVEALDKRLKQGLEVKVTEMPEIKLPDQPAN